MGDKSRWIQNKSPQGHTYTLRKKSARCNFRTSISGLCVNAIMSKKLKCESFIGQTFSLGSMCGPGETYFDPDLTRGRVATYGTAHLNNIAHQSKGPYISVLTLYFQLWRRKSQTLVTILSPKGESGRFNACKSCEKWDSDARKFPKRAWNAYQMKWKTEVMQVASLCSE